MYLFDNNVDCQSTLAVEGRGQPSFVASFIDNLFYFILLLLSGVAVVVEVILVVAVVFIYLFIFLKNTLITAFFLKCQYREWSNFAESELSSLH